MVVDKNKNINVNNFDHDFYLPFLHFAGGKDNIKTNQKAHSRATRVTNE